MHISVCASASAVPNLTNPVNDNLFPLRAEMLDQVSPSASHPLCPALLFLCPFIVQYLRLASGFTFKDFFCVSELYLVMNQIKLGKKQEL
ncbi:hypothetical protein ACTXT7_013831 [Hymenolepis weldensis]